jgi:hypothetical protein
MKAILDRGVREGVFRIQDINTTSEVIIMLIKATEVPFFHQKKFSVFENAIIELLENLMKDLAGRHESVGAQISS